jgi:hypothetical protein
VSPSPHLKAATDSVSETSLSSYLEFRAMDEVIKRSDSVCCYVPVPYFNSALAHKGLNANYGCGRMAFMNIMFINRVHILGLFSSVFSIPS